MTDVLHGIIEQLEQQKAAIERALAALLGFAGLPATAIPAGAPAARKGGITPAGRKRLSAALKKRWAAKKAALGAPARKPLSPGAGRKIALAQKARWARVKGEAEASPATPKRQISAEGLKRIIAATKKRWRLQRAAAKGAKVATTKVGREAAVKAPSPKAARKAAPVRKSATKKAALAPTVVAPTPDLKQAAG